MESKRRVLNFSGHPLGESMEDEIAQRLGSPVFVCELSRMLDDTDLQAEVLSLLDEANVSQREWQESPPVVLLPTLGIASALVVTVIHGLAGYFPRVFWLRRNRATGAFDLLEDFDLTALRNVARARRG